ncbi:hypothetical protein [Neisseria meningitidis]|uniref:hypothetical protein n=1 Tax=Neisseria meningitidis TaxID=487 RepID=UPI0016268F1C|nr:hypothetical protein [Neisseria meningitidis]
MIETGEMTESKRVEMCRKSLKPDKLDSRFCGNDGILGFGLFSGNDGILGFWFVFTAMMGF